MSARRALTLIELVVALSLSAVVGASALAAFLRLARAADDARRRDETRGAADDAVRILREAIEHAPPESTRVLADTAVELLARGGDAAICATELGARWVADTGGDPLNARTWMRAAPRTGAMVVAIDTGGGSRIAVDSVARRSAPASCRGSGASRGWRLVGSAPFGTVGTLISWYHRERWVLYRSGSEWSLGLRDCTLACGTVQPVAGALGAPATGEPALRAIAGGVTIALRDARGTMHRDTAWSP